jgi:hypothetical protein
MPWSERTDGWWLTRHALAARVSAHTGAIDRLWPAADPHTMNWVASAADGWHPISHGWGLGMIGGRPFRGRDDAPVRWQEAEVRPDGDALIAAYACGGWRVTVRRAPVAGTLVERVEITNALDRPRAAGSLWIYTPFRTDVIGGAATLRERCHAHVWAGGRETWIKAVRWSGEGPHVALAVHQGEFTGYGLEGVSEYAGSPVRGDLCLVAQDALDEPAPLRTLAPGESLRFGWTLFAYADDQEFEALLLVHLGRPPARADRYVLTPGESATVGGQVVTAADPGVTTVDVDGAVVNLVTVPDLDQLADARTRFIREQQQDQESGALLPYDNRYDAMLRHPPRRDYNDGRERVGMGVLLAQWRQSHPSDDLVRATDRYADFVATRLQSPGGEVYDSSTDREFRRLYNYPWVCRFWLEMFAATADRRHLDRFVDTVRAYYAAGGADFYAIGMPILRGDRLLRQAGRDQDADDLLRRHRTNADVIRDRGVRYPAHEVPFEQTIVGPAATVLLELHLATGEPELRRDAEPHLRLLELFGGPQPDGRLYDVPIRHWDGYWFGARPRWGDVMPHHWSAVTAWAWALRAAADTDESYARRARHLSQATLHTFTADGRASAAYVYPLVVNGQHEHSFDPLANDQDWALVTALDIRSLGMTE